MNDQTHASGGMRFLTVDEILGEHERLLAAHSAQADLPRVRGFVERLAESGAHFDEASERKAIQGTLDYWTSELAKHPHEHEATAPRRRSIRDFDADALRALQGDFANPFGGFADRMGALRREDRHSPTAIVQLMPQDHLKVEYSYNYVLRLETTAGFVPAERDPGSTDTRNLGAFIRPVFMYGYPPAPLGQIAPPPDGG